MPDDEVTSEPDVNLVGELRARADSLERRLAEAEQDAKSRLILAELKVEAVRAGIVDLDGLKLLDLKEVSLTADGDLYNATQLIPTLRDPDSRGGFPNRLKSDSRWQTSGGLPWQRRSACGRTTTRCSCGR